MSARENGSATAVTQGGNRFLLAVPIVLAAYAYVLWERLREYPNAFEHFGFYPEAIMAMNEGMRWHLFGAVLAIILGGVQMLRPKGTGGHRVIGALWAILMIAMSAGALLGSKEIKALQILAIVVIGLTVYAVWLARKHDVPGHARQMQMLFFAALLGVGLFTAVPGRATWHLFFGGTLHGPNTVPQVK